MKIYKKKLFISDDCVKEIPNWKNDMFNNPAAENFCKTIEDKVNDSKIYRECKELVSKLGEFYLQNTKILKAKGSHFYDQWTYRDNNKPRFVGSWINRHEDTQSLILCIEKDKDIHVSYNSKSLIVVYNEENKHDNEMQIFFPYRGLVTADNWGIMKDELEETIIKKLKNRENVEEEKPKEPYNEKMNSCKEFENFKSANEEDLKDLKSPVEKNEEYIFGHMKVCEGTCEEYFNSIHEYNRPMNQMERAAFDGFLLNAAARRHLCPPLDQVLKIRTPDIRAHLGWCNPCMSDYESNYVEKGLENIS